jgi:hypothetical protein
LFHMMPFYITLNVRRFEWRNIPTL